MANNEIVLRLKVDGAGQLQAVVGSATKAGDALNKTGKHARTADRNLKGAAQASANGTKNFAKMAQGLTGGLVPAYAAVAAQVFALTAAFNFLKNAADLENLKAAQVSYATSTGAAIGAVTRQIQRASNGMLGFKEAAQAAAIGAAKGFTTSQMTEMAAGAAKAAAALGRSYEDTFDRLLRGVSKAEPELLDELGITLRLETATRNYAAAIGVSADKMTAAQRSQAVYVETMKQLNANFGDVEALSNPFVVLGKTLEKIAQDVTQKLLPIFKSIATFVNENAQAAAIAFAGLVGMVLLNISGLKEGAFKLFGAIGSFGIGIFTKTGSGISWLTDKMMSGASKAVDKLDEMEQKIKSTAEIQKGITAGAAKELMQGGAKSKTLEKLSLEMEISPQAKGKLLKDLDRIEDELKTTGKTGSKAFEGATLEGIRKLRKELQKTTKTTLSFGQKLKRVVARSTVSSLKRLRDGFRAVGTWSKKAGVGLRWFSSGVKMVARATVILGILGQLVEAFNALSEAPASAIKSFISFISSIAKGIQAMMNFILEGLNTLASKLPDWAKNRLGIADGSKLFSKITIADDLEDKLTDLADKGLTSIGVEGGLKGLQEQEDATRKAAEETQAYQDRLTQLKEEFGELGKEGKKIAEGILKQEDAYRKVGQRTRGIATMPISAAMKEVAKDPALKGAFDAMIEEIGLDAFGEKYAAAVRSGNIEAVEQLETSAAAYNASKTSLMDSIGNISTTLQSGDPLGARVLMEQLKATATAGDIAAAALGEDGGLAQKLDEELGMSVDSMIAKLRELEAILDGVKEKRNILSMQQAILSRGPSGIAQEEGLRIAAETAALDVTEKKAQLDQLKLDMSNMGAKEREQHNQRVVDLEREIELLEKKSEVANKNLDITARMGQNLGQSLESGLISAFQSIADGTKSVKQAFGDMAIFILQELQKMIIKMLVVKMLQAALGGTDFGNFLGIEKMGTSVPTTRYGGVVGNGSKLPGYRYGGIAEMAVGGVLKGPNAGYPVMMHGTEAVVPLPNGKSIPVEMKGAGQQNNVVVNVSVDNKGNATTTTESQDSSQAGDMGRLIAKAVQEELQNQKRSGGILSPYGVA